MKPEKVYLVEIHYLEHMFDEKIPFAGQLVLDEAYVSRVRATKKKEYVKEHIEDYLDMTNVESGDAVVRVKEVKIA